MNKPRTFWADRTALWFAAVGMVLMALTITWRINPVEGSVVPKFFFDNPIGLVAFWILFATCMPVFAAGMFLGATGFLDGAPGWFPVLNLLLVGLQGLVYFLMGKGVSVCSRRLFKKCGAPKDEVQTRS